jgi:hypothetical protein
VTVGISGVADKITGVLPIGGDLNGVASFSGATTAVSALKMLNAGALGSLASSNSSSRLYSSFLFAGG